jgi:hypothetical protein
MVDITDLLTQFDIFSFVPAIGAAALSIQNWLSLKKGAYLIPAPIVNYGLWAIEASGKQSKALVLPIVVHNDGTKTGTITDLKIKFSSSNNELKVLRKIKLLSVPKTRINSMNINEYRTEGMEELNPFFPIQVMAKQGETFLIECFDGDNLIPIDQDTNCTIEIIYNNGKVGKQSFPFKLTKDQFVEAKDGIRWFRPN